MLDLVVRGAEVVDGTGTPRRRADVGVRDGVIVEIGTIAEAARRTVRAEGLVVAPGFVDVHTHYDAQLFWDPAATPSSLHGVTTVIGGNCGFSLAPLGAGDGGFIPQMMARVEGLPLVSLEAGLDWSWQSFGDWLDRLDGRLAVNAGFLVGHSALRRAVLGDDAWNETPGPDGVERLVRALHEALAAGGLGFSTSQAQTHNDAGGRPVPSRAAAADELVALSGALADHPGTSLELILAGCIGAFSETEMELMANMSLAAGRPLNWNTLGVSARQQAHAAHQLSASDVAEAKGAQVVALTLPYLQRMRLSFATGFVLDGLPGWREVLGLAPADRMVALADPEVRRRLRAGAESKEAGALRGLADWPAIEIAETFAPVNDGLAGRAVRDIASERGHDAFDVVLDIVLADELRTGLLTPSRDDDDESWRLRAELWVDPRTVIGGSDAGAHLDMICGGVMTTAMLAVVRDRELLPLEHAIRELTDVPARLMGLTDRGRLEPGARADMVVFDPETVAPGVAVTKADLPGGAQRLYSEPIGVHHVVVEGVGIVTDGRLTGETPGRLLRSGRDTHNAARSPQVH